MPKRTPEMPLLDIFILFLVRDGIRTLYSLRRDAGISLGAASPSIRRLVERGFLALPRSSFRGKNQYRAGSRGKLEYQVGILAHPFLASDWLVSLKKSSPTDVESVARIVALAEAEHRPEIAKAILSAAITERRKRARQSFPVVKASARAARYRSIVQACESARMKAEAVALAKIRADLK